LIEAGRPPQEIHWLDGMSKGARITNPFSCCDVKPIDRLPETFGVHS